MSILSSVTSILEPTKIPGIVPGEDCKPDDCGDSKQSKRNDDHKGRDDDHSKQAKCDDRCDDGRKDDHSKDGKDDHSKQAKNDCQPHKDDCQPQKDHCDTKPSDDCGKGGTNHSPGEMLAKFDFSHGDLGSHAPDHSDMQGALASLSSNHALDYALGQTGPADHFDIGHFDMPAETHHDAVHHA